MVAERIRESLRSVRIVVSGDQPIIRSGVRRLVESDPGITVAHECENRPEALAEALAMRPDLVLIDFDLGARCNGALHRLELLLVAANGTPVLILTAAADPEALQHALQHGAIGFVFKQRSPDALPRAIRAGVAGEMCIEQSAMAALFDGARHGNGNGNGNGNAKLTSREREIIELVALGLHNKAIARQLCIADTTVRHHLTSVFDKLAVSSRLELMHYILAG